MAVTFRASTTASAAAGSASVLLTKPAGTISGDLMVAFINQPTNTSGVIPPAGWLDITPRFFYNGFSPRPANLPFDSIFIKTAGGAEPANYTFSAGAGTSSFSAAMLGYFNPSGSVSWDAIQGTAFGANPVTTFPITTTQPNEITIGAWFSQTPGALTPTVPAGVTARASVVGSATVNGTGIGDYVGPSTPGSTQPGNATNLGAVWSTFAILTIAANAVPRSPTLTAPANNSYADIAATGGPFAWVYQTGGAVGGQTGYDLRRKVSGGSYSYWNAGSSTFQSTDITNASAAQTLTFGAGVWPDGNIYNWSVANSDANGLGPYAADFTVNASVAPTVSVTSPTGTVATQQPVVFWTPTTAPGAIQSTYQVITYSSAQYSAGGFVPGIAPYADNSGVITSTVGSYLIATPLLVGTSYRSYVQITQTPGGQASPWTAFTSYSVVVDIPHTPLINAAYGTDPITGCPRIVLTVNGQDNILSVNDSSYESGLGTTVGITNCTATTSVTVPPEDGTFTCRLDPTAAGNMAAATASGTSGYIVLPSTAYTIRSDYRAGAATARSCRTDVTWYNSVGTLISTSTGTVVSDSNSAWTTSSFTVTSPATAAFARIVHNVLATAAAHEFHYVDESGIFPGTVATWSIGGFVGTTGVEILRSDGLYIRNASPANQTLYTPSSQQAVVYDYEATPGVTYTYSAVTVSGTTSTSLPVTSGNVSVPLGLGFWELNPANPATAVNAQPIQWNVQNYEQSSTHPVLSQTTANVVSSAMQVSDLVATFSIFSAAIYQAFFNLATSQQTVFVSDPFGFSYYFRLAPAPGGSGGGGHKAHDSQLQASSAGGPHRILAVTGIGQPRPAV